MMSSTTDSTPAIAGDDFTPQVTFPRVIRAEWTKLITARSTVITLLLAFGLMAFGNIFLTLEFPIESGTPIRAATQSTLLAASLMPIAVGVLGILAITMEYSSGTIQTSLLAVPKRTPMLLGKALVVTVVTFVLVGLSSLAAFEVGRLILLGHGFNLDPFEPESLEIVLGGTAFLAGIALLAFAIGALVRNTAGAVTLLMALLYVLPGVVTLAPERFSEAVRPYLPTTLGLNLSMREVGADSFGIGLSLALLFGYGIIGTAIAIVLVKRRDA